MPDPVDCLYRVGKELGVGTYSVVREVRHIISGKWYAAKVIDKRHMHGREHLVRNEVIVLKKISHGHPSILTLVDYFETDDSLYLVTELAKGGELFDRLYTKGYFGESVAAKLVKHITGGVAHLHKHGIVHRDLKPENILLKTPTSPTRLLICDFGLSRIIDDENISMLMTTVGTPSYMAPEIFRRTGHGKPVDIWAIGVITYVLLCGFTPFDSESPAEEREAILDGHVKFEPQEYWIHVTRYASDFILACLKPDPKDRPTAEELLQFPFLTKKYRSDVPEKDPTDDAEYPSELIGEAMNGAYSKEPEEEKRRQVFSAKWG